MQQRQLILIGALLIASTSLKAQPGNLLLELCVNGSCHGSAFVLLRNQHILVDEDALARAHVRVQGQPEQTIGSRRFVDTSALGPAARAKLDMAHDRLVLTLPADAFDNHQLDLRERPKRSTPRAVPSAFVNYAFDVGTGNSSSSAYLDTGVSYGRWLLRNNPFWSRFQGLSRGMTRLEYDDVDHTRRWTLGDQYAFSSDGLGGTALLGGIGLVRAFDLDPYLITFPQPTISGLLQAPGTVDIYENGALVGQRQLAAGPFSLANLGLGPGANNVRVVIHDPFGGTRTLQQNFYGATQMLAKGLSDYAFQIGVERSSTLANGYQAGRGVLLARQSYGFTDMVTAGYRFEAENGLVNAGASVNLRMPLGFLSSGVATSKSRGANGQAGSLAYQYSNRQFGFSAGMQVYSSTYRRIGEDNLPTFLRPRRTSYASANWSPVSRLSLQLSAGDTRYVDGTRQRNIGLNGTLSLAGGASLMLFLNRQINHPGNDDYQAMLNFVMPLGGGSIGFNAGRTQSSGNTYGLSAQRSVPTDNGWGYNVNAQHDGMGSSGMAQLSYQDSYGLLQLSGQRFAGQSSGDLLASGSLIALDGHVFAGRTVQNGYALVETPGTSGVEITRENQPVGKTNADGNLLVTNLLPYQANKLGIDQSSVPLDYQIDGTRQVISVPRLGGAVARFGVHVLHAARGTLTLDGKTTPYGSTRLMVGGESVQSLVGLDGSIYFADLPAGNYLLEAHTQAGKLSCHLTMPASTRPVTDLGRITCKRKHEAKP